jgi:hypothetical protein
MSNVPTEEKGPDALPVPATTSSELPVGEQNSGDNGNKSLGSNSSRTSGKWPTEDGREAKSERDGFMQLSLCELLPLLSQVGE